MESAACKGEEELLLVGPACELFVEALLPQLASDTETAAEQGLQLSSHQLFFQFSAQLTDS